MSARTFGGPAGGCWALACVNTPVATLAITPTTTAAQARDGFVKDGRTIQFSPSFSSILDRSPQRLDRKRMPTITRRRHRLGSFRSEELCARDGAVDQLGQMVAKVVVKGLCRKANAPSAFRPKCPYNFCWSEISPYSQTCINERCCMMRRPPSAAPPTRIRRPCSPGPRWG